MVDVKFSVDKAGPYRFREHFGVVAISAAARISVGKELVVETIYSSVDDANKVIRRNVLFEAIGRHS